MQKREAQRLTNRGFSQGCLNQRPSNRLRVVQHFSLQSSSSFFSLLLLFNTNGRHLCRPATARSQREKGYLLHAEQSHQCGTHDETKQLQMAAMNAREHRDHDRKRHRWARHLLVPKPDLNPLKKETKQMGASGAGGGFYFDLNTPDLNKSEGQKHYEEIIQENKELLTKFSDQISEYCHEGNCKDMGLLIRALTFIIKSGEQILRENAVCSTCQDDSCSAQGKGLAD